MSWVLEVRSVDMYTEKRAIKYGKRGLRPRQIAKSTNQVLFGEVHSRKSPIQTRTESDRGLNFAVTSTKKIAPNLANRK